MSQSCIIESLQELKRKAETNFCEIKTKLSKLQNEYMNLMHVQDKLKQQIKGKRSKTEVNLDGPFDAEVTPSSSKPRKARSLCGRNVAIRVKGPSRSRRLIRRGKSTIRRRKN